ncbi:MAG: rhodanese-like domain-containing protein [Bacteroidaceae bacterium]|nr:rhodanese-like domain-containing protein [Bacteroidaceae bacterium]
MKRLFIFLIATLGLTTACCQQKFENTDPEGFALLIADTTTIVLDVRTVEEYYDAHIAKAINIDVQQDNFVKKAKATLPKNNVIAVYCRSGRRSANAAELLAKKGYKCVNLYGGILAWIESGKPVVQEEERFGENLGY